MTAALDPLWRFRIWRQGQLLDTLQDLPGWPATGDYLELHLDGQSPSKFLITRRSITPKALLVDYDVVRV